jgi:hypothetical protein
MFVSCMSGNGRKSRPNVSAESCVYLHRYNLSLDLFCVVKMSSFPTSPKSDYSLYGGRPFVCGKNPIVTDSLTQTSEGAAHGADCD